MATGAIEIQVDELEIVSRSTPIPFQLDEEGVDETLRLRYRWLDLRRGRLHRNLTLRARLVSTIRQVMESAGFLDLQTPILFKPTPEGARDFVVPSRLQRGRFFALPQSPQILKQLLVIGGFERYYQIAICFRDEDLRADRVQEITQLDVELAFPDTEFILALMEEMCREVWRECIGVELEPPFRRMTYDEAMLRYGTDKPDLRYQLEIADATEVTRVSEFGVFANARVVRGRAPLGCHAPSVHASHARVGGPVRRGPGRRSCARIRPGCERKRDRRRVVADARARPPGARVRSAADVTRGAAREVRLPP